MPTYTPDPWAMVQYPGVSKARKATPAASKVRKTKPRVSAPMPARATGAMTAAKTRAGSKPTSMSAAAKAMMGAARNRIPGKIGPMPGEGLIPVNNTPRGDPIETPVRRMTRLKGMAKGGKVKSFGPSGDMMEGQHMMPGGHMMKGKMAPRKKGKK